MIDLIFIALIVLGFFSLLGKLTLEIINQEK